MEGRPCLLQQTKKTGREVDMDKEITSRDILLRIEAKLDSMIKMEGKIDKLLEILQGNGGGDVQNKVSIKEETEFVVNGVNLLRVPAKDAKAYGRALLDLLFTKHEQKASVVLKSKKSSKPALDPARVEKMFECINRRYGNSYDYQELMTSLNQKCRDAKPDS